MTLREMTFSSNVISGKILKQIQLNLQNQIFILGAPFCHWLSLSIPIIKIFVIHYQQLS